MKKLVLLLVLLFPFLVSCKMIMESLGFIEVEITHDWSGKVRLDGREIENFYKMTYTVPADIDLSVETGLERYYFSHWDAYYTRSGILEYQDYLREPEITISSRPYTFVHAVFVAERNDLVEIGEIGGERQVVFASDKDGEWNVWRMKEDGAGKTNLTNGRLGQTMGFPELKYFKEADTLLAKATYGDGSASLHTKVFLLNLVTGDLVDILERLSLEEDSLAVSCIPESACLDDAAETLAIACGGELIFYEIGSGTELLRFEAPKAVKLGDPEFLPDGGLLLVVSQTEKKLLSRFDRASLEYRVLCTRDSVPGVHLSDDGTQVLVHSLSGRAWMIDSSSGAVLRELPEMEGDIVSTEGGFIVLRDRRGVSILDSDGAELAALPYDDKGWTWSSAGYARYLADSKSLYYTSVAYNSFLFMLEDVKSVNVDIGEVKNLTEVW